MKTLLGILIPVLILGAGVGLATGLYSVRQKAEPQLPEVIAPLVEVMQAEPQDVVLQVAAQGSVQPSRTTVLLPQVAGQVTWISPSFAEGGLVRLGEPLVRIDAKDYELTAAQARSRVSQAELMLAQEQANAEVARAEWKDLGEGAGSPLVSRELHVAQAQAALEAAKAELARAERDVRRTSIVAPFRGRVLDKQVDLGQFISPQRMIARVYAVDVAEVVLPIPDDQLAYVDVPLDGTRVSTARATPVTINASFGGRQHAWQGHVVRTKGQIDPQTRMIEVIAEVKKPFEQAGNRPPLVPGLFVNGQIRGRELSNVFIIPRRAMHTHDTVLVAVDDASAGESSPTVLRTREVVVARSDGDTVVISEGLQAGDQVCVTSLDTFIDGMVVRTSVRSDATEAAR